jgi:hypothetical protein
MAFKPCTYFDQGEPAEPVHVQDHHLAWFVWSMANAPERLDDWLRDLVRGDPNFRPFSAIERFRAAGRLRARAKQPVKSWRMLTGRDPG